MILKSRTGHRKVCRKWKWSGQPFHFFSFYTRRGADSSSTQATFRGRKNTSHWALSKIAKLNVIIWCEWMLFTRRHNNSGRQWKCNACNVAPHQLHNPHPHPHPLHTHTHIIHTPHKHTHTHHTRSNSQSLFFKLIIQCSTLSACYKIALRWLSEPMLTQIYAPYAAIRS